MQIHVTNADVFRPYRTGIAFLKAAHDQAPDKFAWRLRAYEFVDTIPAIDLLAGSSEVRTMIDAGAALPDIAATWATAESEFVQSRRPYLLY